MIRPVVVITGSRSLTDKLTVIRAFRHAVDRAGFRRFAPTGRYMHDALWLHGGARNRAGEPTVDTIIGEYLAELKLHVEVMRPDYTSFAPQYAPLRRNLDMVKRAWKTNGAVIAVWDGQSTGTRDTIEHAARMRVPMFIEVVYPDA